MKTQVTLIFSTICIAVFSQNSEVKVEQSFVLDSLISYQKELNFEKKIHSQYKIQLYSGSKKEVDRVVSEFKSAYPSWYLEMVFETPNYKLRVGAFFSRLEADRELIGLKKKYPNAFVYNK